jgi:hypothetical protein
MPLSEDVEYRIVFGPLEEGAKFVRLILGLSTGAVVLFTNLLVSARLSRFTLAILAVSILAFGLSAIFCLLVMFKLLTARAIHAKAIMQEPREKAEMFRRDLDALVEQTTGLAVKLLWSLGSAILFATLFVFAALLAH